MSKANIGHTTNRIQVSTRVLKKREQGEKGKKKGKLKGKKTSSEKSLLFAFFMASALYHMKCIA